MFTFVKSETGGAIMHLVSPRYEKLLHFLPSGWLRRSGLSDAQKASSSVNKGLSVACEYEKHEKVVRMNYMNKKKGKFL